MCWYRCAGHTLVIAYKLERSFLSACINENNLIIAVEFNASLRGEPRINTGFIGKKFKKVDIATPYDNGKLAGGGELYTTDFLVFLYDFTAVLCEYTGKYEGTEKGSYSNQANDGTHVTEIERCFYSLIWFQAQYKGFSDIDINTMCISGGLPEF
jgi:hypothetical protein